MSTKTPPLRSLPASASLAAALLFPLTASAAPEIAIEQPAGTSLRANGVVVWGNNSNNQLNIPPNLTGVIAIAASKYHSLALKIDGTVTAWGLDDLGVLNVPAGLTGVTAISAGPYHNCVLKSDGTIASWDFYQNMPASPLTNLGVAAGASWSVALKSDTTLVAWGGNLNLVGVPAGVTGLTSVSAGDYHFVGLKSDGTVVAGGNTGSEGVAPPGLTGVVAVDAGDRFSLALKSDGTVVQWGTNNNHGGASILPPAGLNGVVAISAWGHGLALKNNDTLVSWGLELPTPPASLNHIHAIAAGAYHDVAIVGLPIPYGAQNLGTASVAKTFTIKNTGPDPLSITSVSVTGANASEFTVNTTGMLTTLPATTGQTTFSVTFNPVTTGAKKTMLRVVNTDGDEAIFDILLTGTGTVPEIAVTGNGVSIADGDATPSLTDHTDFGALPFAGTGSVTRTFTITNSGTGILTPGNVTIGGTHAVNFTVAAQPAASVASGGSTTFQVTFDPTAVGLRSATLSFSNNDPDENPYNFSIQGTGQEPEIAVSGSSVNIPSGSVPPANFPDVQVSSGSQARLFTVANTGTSPLTLGTLALSGANAADFSVNVPPAASVAAGGTTTFIIVFNPSATGLRTATLSIPNNDADENPFTFTLRGTGVQEEIAVQGDGQNIADGSTSPALLNLTDFGGLYVPSQSRTITYTVVNEGTYPLVVDPVSISGPNASDFTVISQPVSTVAPGASAHFQVTFVPAATGLRTATISFTNNDLNENPFNFAIQGTGITTEISIEGPAGTPLPSGAVTAWGANTLGELNVPAGLHGVIALSGQYRCTTALLGNGTVIGWGENGNGQTTAPAGLRDVVKIAASRWHTVALKQDGTLVAWGFNDYGQCDVSGANGIVAIAVGPEHTVALRANGTFVGWGNNANGEINVPPALTNVTDITAISAGHGHTMALRANGTLVAWGRNYEHEDFVPVGFPIIDIASGYYFNLGRMADGTVACWGENDYDQIGGALRQTGITAMMAGTHHALGLKADGTLSGWGDNSSGQTTIPPGLTGVRAFMAGYQHSAAATDPTFSFGTRVTGQPGAAQTFTVKSTGTTPLHISSLSITGVNPAAFVLNTTGTLTTVPALNGQTTFSINFLPSATGPYSARLRVLSDDPVVPVYDILLTGTGAGPEIAVTGNGTNIVSGDITPAEPDHTDFGETSYAGPPVTRTFTITNSGTLPLHTGAFQISGPAASDFLVTPSPAQTIPAGGSTTFQVTFTPPGTLPAVRNATLSFTSDDADESPFTFALQAHYVVSAFIVEEAPGIELRPVTAPVLQWGFATSGGFQPPPAGLTGVVDAVAGAFHCVALQSDGTVVAWGSNSTSEGEFITVPAGLSGVIKIAANQEHTLALKSDGTVVVWGDSTRPPPPIVPAGLTGVIDIAAAGWQTSAALRNDGTVVVFAGNYGQEVDSAPAGLTGVTAIAGGTNHFLALKDDGTVVAWKFNYGQGGEELNVPAGLTNVTAIAAGSDHNMARKADGTVVAWGDNSEGQITVPPGLGSVTAIWAGFSNSGAVRADGTFALWGNNYHHQLAAPPGLLRVARLSTGYTTLAVIKNTVSFGSRVLGVSSPAKTFTVKNPGAGPLSLTSVSAIGLHPTDFALNTTGMLTTVPSGGQTTFTITFTPSAVGPRTAKLRIVGNNDTAGAFEYVLAGTGIQSLTTPLQDWRLLHFGTTANTGNAADAADPDHDGWSNFFEFQAGLGPNDPQSVFHIRAETDPANPNYNRIIFSPRLPGRTYTLWSSDSMEHGTWQPRTGLTSTSDNGSERTITDLYLSQRRYYRIQVQRQP